MSYNSSEYLYGDQEYIQISPGYSSKNYEEDEYIPEDNEVDNDMEGEEYGRILNSRIPNRRKKKKEYEIVNMELEMKKELKGSNQYFKEKENHSKDLSSRYFASSSKIHTIGSSYLEGSGNRRIQHWVEKYSQKQRKIPVVCIKDGKISQKYMQTAELLRKVHMHNERQILEERVSGALTLRDLRQVVGLHGFERPSIEIRRNCILVNMPGVRCLILHDKVYYLPVSPIVFSPGRDESEIFEIETETEPQLLSHGINKKIDMSNSKLIGFHLKSKTKTQRYIKDSNPRDLSIIEKLIFITRKINVEEAIVSEELKQNTLNSELRSNIETKAPIKDLYNITVSAPEYLKPETKTKPESLHKSNHCSPVKLNLLEIPPSGTTKQNEYQYKASLELNALEICLIEVCKQLWDSYYIIDDTAQDFLLHIENNPTSTQKVYEINDLRKRLDSLRDRIKGVYEAIKEILDDDDLLIRIEISKFWNNPENWDNKAILESTFFDSEILLECYEQEVEGLIRTVNRLNAQLDDAIEVMQIHLATIRNNFLKGEISLDIVGVCVGFVSAIASIFGMNIQSGLEKNVDIFWFMAYTMITLCVFAGIVVILMFRRLQL
ncbi:CorA family mitochondrial membrane protein [Cryptosporidium tyzzeri]|nr:CorA family mitochondrial membrane protein [Cryptosporidium tyzzeri]